MHIFENKFYVSYSGVWLYKTDQAWGELSHGYAYAESEIFGMGI